MRSLVPLVFLLLASQSVAAAADTTTMLWFDQPAGRFQQSLPLGNGASVLWSSAGSARSGSC